MHVIRENSLAETPDDDPDVDFEFLGHSQFWGPHTSSIPLMSAVQAPRLFYGARFANQALSLETGEEPLVQNLNELDPKGRSFDEILGDKMGAKRARKPGVVRRITPDSIVMQYDDGEKEELGTPKDFLFNQKSGINVTPLVKAGDKVTQDQLLARSNFTNEKGVMALGKNARIGIVPWKGYSMDDAIVLREGYASDLKSIHYQMEKMDKSDSLETDPKKFRAQFANRFPKEKYENFSDDGVIKVGTILEEGDPIILGTMPRTVSSAGANIGKLSRAVATNRRDASKVWSEKVPAKVVGAVKTKNGIKVALKYIKPTKEGDKLTLRQGAKATVSKLIPDDQMPRTDDGQPLDVMLNPLSLLSRANPATQHEIRLGNIAKKLGKPLKLPGYLPRGEDWNDKIAAMEAEHGVSPKQRIYDPESDSYLEDPVTVGYGFLNKLHHVSSGKVSQRGTGSYDSDQQPTRGGGEMAKAKRYSGLENYATLSSGNYALMRENSTIRGQRDDDFWRSLRSGKPLPKAGEPFVFHKFRHLLAGAGINAREVGKGKFRLAPFTDKDLDEKNPVDISSGELVDLKDLSPIKGGLFDERIVAGDKWGRIKLPRPVINPAMEESVRTILGITKKDLQSVLAGEVDLEDVMNKK